jgi:hypothetical protein
MPAMRATISTSLISRDQSSGPEVCGKRNSSSENAARSGTSDRHELSAHWRGAMFQN